MILRSKLHYTGHHRFLPKNHKFHQSDKYDASRETRDLPKELSREDILEQFDNPKILNWTKKAYALSWNTDLI